MSNTYNGAAINFGITGLTFTYASLTGFFLPQDLEHSIIRDTDSVRNGSGAIVQRTHYNPEQKATIKWIVTGTGLGVAVTNTVLPDMGVFINISACADYPPLVQSTWEVTSPAKMSATNTKAKMISVEVTYNSNITTASSA